LLYSNDGSITQCAHEQAIEEIDRI